MNFVRTPTQSTPCEIQVFKSGVAFVGSFTRVNDGRALLWLSELLLRVIEAARIRAERSAAAAVALALVKQPRLAIGGGG